MTAPRLIFLGAYEIIAFVVVARMWMKRWHSGMVVRIIWSAVLLVPVFGLLFYFFLRDSPDRHPDYMEEFGSASDAGGGHGADGH